jgi:hypothetical protein
MVYDSFVTGRPGGRFRTTENAHAALVSCLFAQGGAVF